MALDATRPHSEPPATGRTLARDALFAWSRQPQAHADLVLRACIEAAPPPASPADPAFARELFYGVLRNLRALDFLIDRLVARPPADGAHRILQLGLYQIFFLQTPPHAAINETVALARKGQRGFINGVLRTADRQSRALRATLATQPLAVRYSHPDFLVNRWIDHFGQDTTERLLAWNNQPAPLYLRHRQPPSDPEEIVRRHPALAPTEHPNFYRATHLPTDLAVASEFYVQDPSTLAVCEALDPRPGERLLDTCAAPGGKTAALHDLAQGGVEEIVATDSSPDRLALLAANIQRLGLGTIRLLEHDWETGSPPGIGLFDKILVDAPCSNTGVLRRRVDLRWRLQPGDFTHWAARQQRLLASAATVLKSGGQIAYSTCSLDREENDQVTDAFLAAHPAFRLLTARQLRPDRDAVDGAYYALFEKAG